MSKRKKYKDPRWVKNRLGKYADWPVATTTDFLMNDHVHKVIAEDLKPDKDGMGQVQFDFGPPEPAELTAEEATALDFLQKDAEADAEAEDTEQRAGLIRRYLEPIWRLKLPRTLESDTSMRIARPPGSLITSISEFLFSKKTLERVVRPIIADMQAEYFEALAAKRPYKAAWVRLRGYWSFAKAVSLYSVVKAAVEVWRKVAL